MRTQTRVANIYKCIYAYIRTQLRASRTGPKEAPKKGPTTGSMLFCLEKRQEHQEAGHTGHLDVRDLALQWSVFSEEERKPWMERAVDFEYSSCHVILAGAVLLPPRVATAETVPFPS